MAAFTFTLVTRMLAASGCAATACRDDQAFAWLAEARGSTGAQKDRNFPGSSRAMGRKTTSICSSLHGFIAGPNWDLQIRWVPR
jgi:hypothetical protein